MIFDDYRQDMVGRGIKLHSLATYDRVSRLFTGWVQAQGDDLRSVRRAQVQAFLQQTGWAPSTQRTALAYLRAAYGYAVDELELLERNPCRRVRLQRPPQKVPRTIPNRILRELRSETRDGNDALLLALFMWTGARTIGVRRLTWNDVSLADNTILLKEKFDKERLVPIHPELRRLLVGRTWAHGHTHVAAGRRGDLVSPAGLHYRMKRVCGGRDIHNHDFRRTVATSLRANRVDPYVRDAIMGWGRDEMFALHYNAVSVEEMAEAILKLYANDPV